MISVKCSVLISQEEAIKGTFAPENQQRVNEWKEQFEKALTRIPTPTGSSIIVDIIELDTNVWIVRSNIHTFNSQMNELLKKYFPDHQFKWTL